MQRLKRTTVLLDENVYNALVSESLEEYKTTKAISKVMNEILNRYLTNRAQITGLLHSKKLARTTAKEFERFRSGLSKAV